MDALDALRLLTSLELPGRRQPGRRLDLGADAPWPEIADLAVNHGLAPLVAWSVDHRMGGGAPDEVRDRLLGYYQGTVNDNVFKLVTLRRLLAEVDVPVVLLTGAAYSDALYPHVAFRPLPELRLLARRSDFMTLVRAGQPQGLSAVGEEEGGLLLTDGRTRFLLHDALWPAREGERFEDLHGRGVSARVFGAQVRRPGIEDAVLTHVSLLAKSGFAAPLVELVDLRELALGSPSQSGTWSRPPDARTVLARADSVGLTRALYCAMAWLARTFPAASQAAERLTPSLNAATRALLDLAVVAPSTRLDRTEVLRSADRVRKVLTEA